jgi:hypothetical protein
VQIAATWSSSSQNRTDAVPPVQRGDRRPEAVGSAPADPADWTPITAAAGSGDLNGKLVVAGAGGTMGERSADLIISDYVLPTGYAYVSQNKGMFNFAITTVDDPLACPWSNSLLRRPGTPENPFLYLFLLDAQRPRGPARAGRGLPGARREQRRAPAAADHRPRHAHPEPRADPAARARRVRSPREVGREGSAGAAEPVRPARRRDQRDARCATLHAP